MSGSWFIYHNFLRPYLSLKGKTPAEACEVRSNILSIQVDKVCFG